VIAVARLLVTRATGVCLFLLIENCLISCATSKGRTVQVEIAQMWREAYPGAEMLGSLPAATERSA